MMLIWCIVSRLREKCAKYIYQNKMLRLRKSKYAKHICYPIQLELCVKSLLYKYRYVNKREFYECELNKIIEVVENCAKVINKNKLKRNKCEFNNNKCNQQGGNDNNMEMKEIDDFINKLNICKQIYILKVQYYDQYMKEINNVI
jgi:hypothetical protein